MMVGAYTELFTSAISPWTTLGPLALVVAFSLLVEGSADVKRHRNDSETNNAPCTILRRTDEFEREEGAVRDEHIIKGRDCVVNLRPYVIDSQHPTGLEESDQTNASSSGKGGGGAAAGKQTVKVAFQRVPRMDIRQGHLVLVKNRELVPADMVLLASSNDHGSAFIETSSIDGETNLKLRNSPRLPKNYLKHLRTGAALDAIHEGPEAEEFAGDEEEGDEQDGGVRIDSVEDATKRLTRISYLGRPNAKSALDHPDYAGAKPVKLDSGGTSSRMSRFISMLKSAMPRRRESVAFGGGAGMGDRSGQIKQDDGIYVCVLTTEPPNPSVHTFMGKLTLPPLKAGSAPLDIPLDAENVLLRGAVIRNTEWAIGAVFFTGPDTKLVQNSFKTKSKFSQLDRLMNWTVVAILFIMFFCITYLASQALVQTNANFDQLWYTGLNKNTTQPWPYLPDLEVPDWNTSSQNWFQYFFLFVTLLTNFVPLSLYVTVEFITFCMLWFIYADVDMYDDTTNTRAAARSTIVTDLGQIQYIFSDKTGTLTQNVMRFKRCSVDGMVFGAPIQKSRPGEEAVAEPPSVFHPLRQLLVGRFRSPKQAGLEGLGDTASEPATPSSGQMLTFNAEMFLRVMSLCHTVVVEKDIDKKETIDASESVSSAASSKGFGKKIFARIRANTGDSLPPVAEEEHESVEIDNISGHGIGNRVRISSVESFAPGQEGDNMKSPDGAPSGYAYQAESPDEGALVSAASQTYGFQVVSRDSSGITLQLTSPSHLQNARVAEGLKSGSLSLRHLAAESADEIDENRQVDHSIMESVLLREPRKETWTILAVNKFDSDRKRMSVLLRSPPELGDVPILFCKGADTAMLDPEVCASRSWLQDESIANLPRPSTITHQHRDVSLLSAVSEGSNEGDDAGDEWEMAQLLGLQAHLGDFASEGLRTLVLGMRVLTEDECSSWLEEYKAAATSLRNRAELLSKAASNVERHIYIVGATAIEDKLQNKVPETIATLEKAGIKLWVLTGDKRETAVEIGYSTHVLTPKMHLTEVPDNGKMHVRTQMSMEFMRLIKMGKLVEYQMTSLSGTGRRTIRQAFQDCSFSVGKCFRAFMRAVYGMLASLLLLLGCTKLSKKIAERLKEKTAEEALRLKEIELRRRVRSHAEKQIKAWLLSDKGKKQTAARGMETDEDISLASEETPAVFSRASSAKQMLSDLKSTGRLSGAQLREVSLAQLTAQQADEEPLVDEDTLSMASFFPGNKDDLGGNFDKRKRTLLERLFAIDRQVRKGQLVKHLKGEKLASIAEHHVRDERSTTSLPREGAGAHGPRALVIEGAALKHLLGNTEMEAILFAVASNCDAVIACRVSPKQKAELLNLVRLNVKPEPITLAIGDGANDVGMIQEAHVGVGISGKEGQQAVNASDFAIAQFRFLEDLLLVHGRWNFFRQSTVVLFSFYKNAILAGMLIVYAPKTLYSGTPLFDEWLIAMLNFVAGAPIIVLGLFDRCLDKDYVKNNPQVYKATRENELITSRTLTRWILLVFVHIFTLYYLTVFQQSGGGGMTPAWDGLMGNKDRYQPGDGEGGDLKSVGTVTYTCMVLLLAYKVGIALRVIALRVFIFEMAYPIRCFRHIQVLYESKALIHGRWPAFTCRKGVGEGFFSRVAYTWHGIAFFSIGFYLFAIGVYGALGHIGPSQFSSFTNVTGHVLTTRTLSWIIMVFIPIAGIAFDIIGKVFSNMFYPTQTQIHVELESKQKAKNEKRQLLRASSWQRQERTVEEP